MIMKISMVPSMCATLQLSVGRCGYLIDLMDSFQHCGKKSLSIRLGQTPISNKLANVRKAIGDTLTKVLMGYVDF